MRRRVTPSLVLSLLAVVLACTGSAVAGGLITGKQVKDGSLTGRDVKDKSLTPADFKGSVQGPQGAQGLPGAAGAAGPPGPAGPTVVNKLTRVKQDAVIAAGNIGSVTATCPAGQNVVTGGYSDDSGLVFGNDSFGGANSWSVLLDNYASSVSSNVSAMAYCAPAGQAVSTRSVSGRDVQSTIDALIAARKQHSP
ncbi:MAG: hypothetical protein JWO74_2285 [Solirubrobacterales bacterium]|nr:hypothetical protein [Solirubrobacterales bacterium]